jgi:HK97 gp10 family phage protein
MSKVIVKNNIPRILATVDAARTNAVVKAGEAIELKSQNMVPVDTGDLKRSSKRDIDNGPGTTTAEVSYNTGYAIFVELGTSKMPAQPYLLPAYHSGKGYLIINLMRWLRSL